MDIEKEVSDFVMKMCGKLDGNTYNNTVQQIVGILTKAVTNNTDDSVQLSDDMVEAIRGVW